VCVCVEKTCSEPCIILLIKFVIFRDALIMWYRYFKSRFLTIF